MLTSRSGAGNRRADGAAARPGDIAASPWHMVHCADLHRCSESTHQWGAWKPTAGPETLLGPAAVCEPVRVTPSEWSEMRMPDQQGAAAPLARPAAGRALAWRPVSTAERLGLTGLAAAGASFAYPAVSAATGLQVLCPLRLLTGVPCPFCGMTTAATALAGGEPAAALAANPFVLVLVGFTAAMAVLIGARALGLAGPPARWPLARRRGAWAVAAVLAAASWLFQLHRFELI
jgi:Protein of unknown function (DUF2752)